MTCVVCLGDGEAIVEHLSRHVMHDGDSGWYVASDIFRTEDCGGCSGSRTRLLVPVRPVTRVFATDPTEVCGEDAVAEYVAWRRAHAGGRSCGTCLSCRESEAS